HGSLLVVVLLWNFLKVKNFQDWLHLLINKSIRMERVGKPTFFLCYLIEYLIEAKTIIGK
ncbi:MAG: hypothetical protein U0N55_07720, partial [Streptococcus salivarius]